MEETIPSPTGSGGLPATLAIVAAVGGVALLVLAAFEFGSAPDPPPDVVDVAATSTPIATRVESTTTSFTFDPGSFVAIEDDSGAIAVEIPSGWTEVSGTGWAVDGEPVGVAVTAAPDIDAWYSTWETPGAFIGVSTSGFRPDPGDFSAVCTPGPQSDRRTDVVSGRVHSWTGCGEEGSGFYVFVGETVDGGVPVLVQAVILDGGGGATFDHLMNTLSIRP